MVPTLSANGRDAGSWHPLRLRARLEGLRGPAYRAGPQVPGGATIARCAPCSCWPFWLSPWRSSPRRGPATRGGAGTCGSIECCGRIPRGSSAHLPSGRAIPDVEGLGGWPRPMSATPSLTRVPVDASAAGTARRGRSTIRCRGCDAAWASGASPSAICFRAGERLPAVGNSFTQGHPGARVGGGSGRRPRAWGLVTVAAGVLARARMCGSQHLVAPGAFRVPKWIRAGADLGNAHVSAEHQERTVSVLVFDGSGALGSLGPIHGPRAREGADSVPERASRLPAHPSAR
jgi:hypothetical protein